MADISVKLWLRTDAFSIGALQVAPHPKLSIHYLKKIAAYAKTKGKVGFPKISYSVWKHIACHKLSISEDLAWMYFEGFKLLTPASSEERLNLSQREAECMDDVQKASLHSQLVVDTMPFLVYLFIQQVHKISLRSSLISGQEWPLRPKSPDLEGRSSNASVAKGLDEANHMTFLLMHLHDLLSLLAEADIYATTSADVYLSEPAVQALGVLIEGNTDKDRQIKSVFEIAKEQQIQAKSGYSKITVAFSFKTFESWIRTNLMLPPYGITACVTLGQRLSWPTTGGDLESNKRGKIATNANKAPRSHKLVILSQICKQTLSKTSNTLINARVKIHRCHNAYIYLLSPMRCVNIDKCRNSTIVLGAVETTIHIHSCEHVKVICTTRRFSISGSTLCTLHLLTPSRPLILGGNDSITLAPYHTHYPTLEHHMTSIGLGSFINLWNQPLCVGPDHQDNQPVYQLMPPSELFLFVIPFEMEGSTKDVPGGLPAVYSKAVKDRENQLKTWQTMVKDAGLQSSQRKQFQELVEAKFQAWLAESGHSRELDGLVTSLPSPTK